MLAHVVDAALKHDRDAARAATRGAAPYPQKSKSKVAALDALLIRAETDDDEDKFQRSDAADAEDSYGDQNTSYYVNRSPIPVKL